MIFFDLGHDLMIAFMHCRQLLIHSLAALCLLLPLTARAQCLPAPDLTKVLQAAPTAEVKNTGYLWTFEKDGRTSYLHGTIHLATQAWAKPSAQTLRALAATDLLALELNLLDPAIAEQAAAGLKQLGPNQADAATVTASLQAERIQRLADKLCAPQVQAAGQGVTLQLMGLMLADARYAGLEALYGRDLVLGVFAQATKKPITSLETVQTQMQVIGGDINEQQVIAFLDKLEQGSMRRPLEKITQAWADNDLQTLENYEDWCECAGDPLSGQAFAKINDDRNPGMAEAIDKLHSQGQRVFVAVGSLHMTGPKGLPKLLQAMGYSVTRVF
jgi:uncharacterized protein